MNLDTKVIEAFQLMWENFPEPFTLCTRAVKSLP
jgi:hypothetical protein